MPVPMNAEQIAADLEARITAGEYPPGSQLPTIESLAKIYSVHPSTISRASLILKAKGAVIGAPGRGVFVPEAE